MPLLNTILRRNTISRPRQLSRVQIERLEERCLCSLSAPVGSPGQSLLAVGDVNRDGRSDIVTLGCQIEFEGPYGFATALLKGKPVVNLSNGDGTFRRAVSLSGAKGDYVKEFTLQDNNGDGILDLLLRTQSKNGKSVLVFEGSGTQYTYYVTVWLGKGDGTFGGAKTTSYQALSAPSWIPLPAHVYLPPTFTSADFNHDGIADQASTLPSSGLVTISLGKPDGTLQSPLTYPAGSSPYVIAAGDFDGDGWMDVIVINNWSSTQPTLSVLLNDHIW